MVISEQSKMSNLANLDKIKYQFERNTIVPGYYTLHRPSACNLKFPKDNRPIHKKLKDAYEGKNVITVSQNGRIRRMIVPTDEKIVYPAIWQQEDYDRLKRLAVPRTDPATLAKNSEEEAKRRAEAYETRKKTLDSKLKSQPGYVFEGSNDSIKNEKTVKTLKRAEGMKEEEFQGARIANQIILAAKCHAIRDEQIKEKAVIVKQVEEENKRLDAMMEEVRVEALKKEQMKIEEQKIRKLNNIKYIKEQILENERQKEVEYARIHREYAKNGRDSADAKSYENERLQTKRENAQKLRALLDKAKEELEEIKQKQAEENRLLEERINNFKSQRNEREMRFKADTNAKSAARSKIIDNIALTQKIEQELRKKSENLRNLKVLEDVEREYRMREKNIAIKRIKDMEKLKAERKKQIEEIRKQYAVELAKDEDIYKVVIRHNEIKEKAEIEAQNAKQKALKGFRTSIMEQIENKAVKRAEYAKKNILEDTTFLTEIKRQDDKEREVIRNKIVEMKRQNIPEKYVREVEQRLTKLKYY